MTATHVRADGTVLTTSRVAPMTASPVGAMAHRAAVDRLQASYRAVPEGSPIRLAKRTSNLFRPRAASATPGLDVTGLGDVISLDLDHPDGPTADVQGMCTYERLVATTLAHGHMPRVVPQLRTITLGGAVTGLGIESSSFRNGLPHESVRELDVLTGDGRVVTTTPDGEHADLFGAFPNSYGTLGYATRLRIELDPVQPYVRTRNLRFGSLEELTEAIGAIVATRSWHDDPVDFLDGVMFSAEESYLVLGSWANDRHTAARLSDYTGGQVYYRSLPERPTDALTVLDYLWRWDTDWFWCSRAFGAQNPTVRRLWPAALRRSDVYHRLVGLENRYHVAARIDRRRGLPARERVVQDIEVPLERTASFLRWYLDHVPMTPVWLCPLVGQGTWSLYPLPPGATYVNVGFWGTVPIEPGRSDGDVNRLVEQAVSDHHGHKSLYSDAYYTEDDFWTRYGGQTYPEVKQRYDPDGRLPDLFTKVVGRS
ncbi:MAG: FAD-binding oxidoreductase [Kineosporiaceae bacterium]|nr:FAD-binding oxidoreductase [Kineosporiaceae bacterium]